MILVYYQTSAINSATHTQKHKIHLCMKIDDDSGLWEISLSDICSGYLQILKNMYLTVTASRLKKQLKINCHTKTSIQNKSNCISSVVTEIKLA